ncbi:carbohydrate-binding module family 18 protein [Echria macrotheca]|uniref:Carbohydrate-binding module family 18 protein n=1 Tax=Echria macrotheca TaxID=438768 RepID=A0AAJ0F5A6_9PEZI|nr:carbohydrate-binding module family 18 protein [Echria macrotheca]
MLTYVAAVLLAVPAVLAGVVPVTRLEIDERALSVVSPNLTCGTVLGGANKGYTCPSEVACCSAYGYCGSSDEFCLTTAGCQSRYSNSSTSCTAPKSGVSISVDGTCGTTGAGKNGYRCPVNGTSCCSASGYCGNSTDHCDVNQGCQANFGKCTGTKTPRNVVELAMHTVFGRNLE